MSDGPWTVWLASYPKSGNTWVRAMLTALTGSGDDEDDDDGAGDPLDINALGHGPIASGRGHFERYTGLPSGELTRAEITMLRARVERHVDGLLTRTRFRKIHDGLFTSADGGPIVPPDATLGAVYIVRDPRDVAVSWAHHAGIDHERSVEHLGSPRQAMARGRRRIDIQLRQHLGTWSEHVRGWLDHDAFPVLLVRYEDMKEDAARELRRIAEFAGLEASAVAIERAVMEAEFERLRQMEAEDGFRETAWERVFFRRGVAGAWHDELAPELVQRVEADHAEVMARLGYEP